MIGRRSVGRGWGLGLRLGGPAREPADLGPQARQAPRAEAEHGDEDPHPAAQGPQTSSFSLVRPVPDPDSAVSGPGSAASAPLPPVSPPKVRLEEPEERTVVGPAFDDDVPQALRELEEEVGEGTSVNISAGNVELPHVQSISQEKTVVFQRSSISKSLPGKVSSSERSPKGPTNSGCRGPSPSGLSLDIIGRCDLKLGGASTCGREEEQWDGDNG